MSKLSISGLNILFKITKDTDSDRRDFLSERILKYWNILPKNIKMSMSVNRCKANLENYKVRSLTNIFSISFSRVLLFLRSSFKTVFKYDYRSYKLLLTYMLYLASILIIIIIGDQLGGGVMTRRLLL